jgi:endonuclease YncB( thermonuclease family)
MTGPTDLYKFRLLLLPWDVRGLTTWGNTGSAWHDGDTFNALVSQGMNNYWLGHVRCAGYNAPEVKTGLPGALATAYARSLVDTRGIAYSDSLKFEPNNEQDSFGRMLGRITLSDSRDLADEMIAAGQAVPF